MTGSPLYLQEGEFSYNNQWLSSDGVMGDSYVLIRTLEMILLEFVTT